MKIAFIGQKGIPTISGGVERYVESVATELVAHGHDVTVYARTHYTSKHITEYKGVQIVHLPSIQTKHLDAITHSFLATLHAIVKNYDVVHYQAIGPALLSWMPRLLSRAVIVTTLQSQDYFHQKWGWFARTMLHMGERIACASSHRLIAVTDIYAHYVEKKYNVTTTIIPNGADVEYTEEENKLKKWSLSPKEYVLSVSRLVPHKKIDQLVSSFVTLIDQGKITENLKLVIVGDSAHTDDYAERVRAMAMNHKERIIFTGTQSGKTLQQLFSHAVLFVQPSLSEGLSLALLESMGYGVAPLVSDIAENVYAVGKDENLVFRAGDQNNLTKKIAHALSDLDATRARGKDASLRCQEKFDWKEITKKIDIVYAQGYYATRVRGERTITKAS